MFWTGVYNAAEAQRTSPVNDWHLAGLLASLLNTNASPVFFPVNNPNTNAWAAQFNGLIAWTNYPPPYTPIILSSNSAAVASVVNAIQSTRVSEPGGLFLEVGNISRLAH